MVCVLPNVSWGRWRRGGPAGRTPGCVDHSKLPAYNAAHCGASGILDRYSVERRVESDAMASDLSARPTAASQAPSVGGRLTDLTTRRLTRGMHVIWEVGQ